MACHLLAVFAQLFLFIHWLCWTFLMRWLLFYLLKLSLLLVGVGVIFFWRLYIIVHHRHLLRHMFYWLLRHFEVLFIAFFHLVELFFVLLLYHGKIYRRVILFIFYLGSFLFHVVGTVKFGLLACRGAWELCAILLQFEKLYLDVGPCFVACGLILSLDHTLLCEVIRLPYLGDSNSNLFIAAIVISLASIFLVSSYKFFQFIFMYEVVSHGLLCPFFYLDFSNVVILMHVLLWMCCIIFFGVTPPYPMYLCLITTTTSYPAP